MNTFLQTFKSVQKMAARDYHTKTKGNLSNSEELFVLKKFAKLWAKHEVQFEDRMYSDAEIWHIVRQTARVVEMHPVFDEKCHRTGEEFEVIHYEFMDDYEHNILMSALVEQAKKEGVYSGTCTAGIFDKYGRTVICRECKNCEMDSKFYARLTKERHERERVAEEKELLARMKYSRVNLVKHVQTEEGDV